MLDKENDLRNIRDEFKGWTEDLIKERLKKELFEYAVLFEHIIGDFNMGTGVRNANIFNAAEVFYYGKRKVDKRSMVGTYKYTDLRYLENFDEVKKLKERYTFIGVDCVSGAIPMEPFVWPKNSLMLFGEEGKGLSPEALALCENVVMIKMYGSCRSLNVGTASGIAMFDYCNKFEAGMIK